MPYLILGCNFYLSCWYRRSEFGVRSAIFFSAAAIAGSFGGLLAAAITNMHDVGGKPGWAWIFILEGLLTIVIGVISIWMVHDFPDEATFLSEEDRLRVYHRLKKDQQSSAEHESFQWAHVMASLRDWKTYTGCLIYMGAGGGLYAFSLFLPTSKPSSRLVKIALLTKTNSSCRARVPDYHGTADVGPALCRSSIAYYWSRVLSGQDTTARAIRGVSLVLGHHRLWHPH